MSTLAKFQLLRPNLPQVLAQDSVWHGGIQDPSLPARFGRFLEQNHQLLPIIDRLVVESQLPANASTDPSTDAEALGF